MSELSKFGQSIYDLKYREPGETWEDYGPGTRSTPRRVVENVMGPLLPELVEEMIRYIADLKFMPGGRYLYASGKTFHQTQNCLLLSVGDSREEWASLMQRVTSGLMTGAGIGCVYSGLRERGARVSGMGGTSTGPIALMQMVNEDGRHIMQGGSRRAALWAGLHWWHPDVFEFIHLKDWSDDIRALKAKDFNFPAPMDGTNISVILDTQFFSAIDDPDYSPDNWDRNPLTDRPWDVPRDMTPHEWAQQVYWEVVSQMLTTAEPGFSIDAFENEGENLRNACTEITSYDDNDICNLGSLNLARIESRAEFARIVEVATAFLLCGTVYSKVPYEGVAETREMNRRLGLGLMGIYEWLAVRGKPYAPDSELGGWLEEYEQSTQIAVRYADRLGISRPLKTRGIAPTGSIAIVAGTTSGAEPMLAAAIKRRYLKGDQWHYQYVVDACAQRLIDRGVDPSVLEDAYDLAQDPERRIAFQAWLQGYVDHAISSTINLPAPDQQPFSDAEFGLILLRYLPNLRGITVYPDGARGGQPLTKVDLQEALDWSGYEYAETGNEQACVSGVCGA